MHSMPYMYRLREKLLARKVWEAANPGLAAEWSDAIQEDAAREAYREHRERIGAAALAACEFIRKLGLQQVDDPKPTQAMSDAHRFLQGKTAESRVWLLLGSTGVGKTVAATWVLGRVVSRAISQPRPSGGESRAVPPGIFVRAATLGMFQPHMPEQRDELEDWCLTPCLVIDDLGSEPDTKHLLPTLEYVIDRRVSRLCRTVITSNLDKASFKRRYGERIADRIRPHGLISSLSGPSMRKR